MKILFPLLFCTMITSVILIGACDNDNDNASSCATKCNMPVTSTETAATVPSGLVGTYTLTYTQINPGGPFSDGDTATFQISANNRMVVTYKGQCVDIGNPILFAPGTIEVNFRDNCQFNVLFGASEKVSGGLNEINVGTLSFGFLGQFTAD
jgi:hypothetical protein